jgi:hypothetical protein
LNFEFSIGLGGQRYILTPTLLEGLPELSKESQTIDRHIITLERKEK